MPDAMGTSERHDELDVALFVCTMSRALNHERADTTMMANDGDGEKHREPVLVQLRKLSVALVLRGLHHGNRAHALDRHAGDALTDGKTHRSARALREADVATQDELVAVALE